MSKERYLITITATEEKDRLITVEAPDFQPDQLVACQTLLYFIRYLRNYYPEPLIQVRTPKITGPQLENLFDAGANAFTLLTKTEKSSQT